jgi:DNA modification methylase
MSGILIGDVRDVLDTLPAESVHCCITSPPYWGLRSYLPADSPDKHREIGAEATPEEYVATMVDVFSRVRRVLRADGTLWLNLGDSYAGSSMSGGVGAGTIAGTQQGERKGADLRFKAAAPVPPGLKPKDLCLIPYRVALALQADGWYLRSNIVWAKGLSFCEHYAGSVMPESVQDRPTSAHEAVFLLSKSQRYFYDADAVREAHRREWWSETRGPKYMTAEDGRNDGGKCEGEGNPAGRNLRNVWAISPRPYSGSHYAVFPPHLVAPMVKAGCPKGGTVLDPFLGSGTTAQVAQDHGRKWIGIDLDERNKALIHKRTAQQSLLG